MNYVLWAGAGPPRAATVALRRESLHVGIVYVPVTRLSVMTYVVPSTLELRYRLPPPAIMVI